MPDLFLVAAASCGFVVVGVYRFIAWWRGTKATVADVAVLFISGATVVHGIKVCYIAFDPKALAGYEGERIYVMVGGIALVWVSIEAINRILRLTWERGLDSKVEGDDDRETNRESLEQLGVSPRRPR